MFWRKAAERARGGVPAEPRSAPGSGGKSVPRSSCASFPWEWAEERGGDGFKGGNRGRKRRLGQIEAALLRQQQRKRREMAVFDER